MVNFTIGFRTLWFEFMDCEKISVVKTYFRLRGSEISKIHNRLGAMGEVKDVVSKIPRSGLNRQVPIFLYTCVCKHVGF